VYIWTLNRLLKVIRIQFGTPDYQIRLGGGLRYDY